MSGFEALLKSKPCGCLPRAMEVKLCLIFCRILAATNKIMMKYLLLLSLLLPRLASGQVKMNDLITKRGLSYEMAGRTPFTGKAYAYFANGDTQTVVTYKEGIPNGEIIGWYPKNIKQIEGLVENGERAGVWKLYFESGKIKKQTAYSHNIEDGEETFWFENGNTEKKGTYIEGKLDGRYTWYYENGQKKQEGFFRAGREDSTWSEWDSTGKQKMVGHLTNFEKNGDWTYWDGQGNITVKKNYQHGLVIVAKDDFDTYVEKMEYYLAKKNYKEALKNVEAAEAILTTKTDTSQVYMDLLVYHSKCYSFFSHYSQGEKILLDAIGLTPAQTAIIQNSYLEKAPAKINQLITEINQKEQAGFKTTNHIALALCYNIIGDSVNYQQQQQIAMIKGGLKGYIVTLSLELDRLAGTRSDYYQALQDVNTRITKGGATEKLELEKARYLIGNEKFEEAQKIIDKYLQKDGKNVSLLLLKADLETDLGDVDKTKLYENKAVAIDPGALGGAKN
jgi:antitoxin component YwqK of YwqJK toxin-antitoxin module